MDVIDWGVGEGLGGAESAGAFSLVGDREVEVARLVVTPRAYRVLDVVENVILGDPCVGLGEATGEEVHAVGRAQW